MTHDLLILHRKGPERFAFMNPPLLNEGVDFGYWFSFQTCMRHIVLGDADDLQAVQSLLKPEDEVHIGDDAYRFLLQVICGLHSPLIGETEVYGQFKNAVSLYKAPNSPWGFNLSKSFRSLFEDAKNIRQTHLNDLGSQSYGSVLRRELKGLSRVDILGAGHLVREILPWIAKDGTEIHVHCRNPEKARSELGPQANRVVIHSLSNRLKDQTKDQTKDQSLKESEALVIAAPVSANWLKGWVKSDVSPLIVVDLRSDSGSDRLTGFDRVISLPELVERISSNQVVLMARLRAALGAVDEAVLERSSHVEYRPFGWEDVSA